MRDWRNRQTRTFKGRVRDRVSSSLTSRTKRTHKCVSFFIWGEATQVAVAKQRCETWSPQPSEANATSHRRVHLAPNKRTFAKQRFFFFVLGRGNASCSCVATM